jgi:hypothetical protein
LNKKSRRQSKISLQKEFTRLDRLFAKSASRLRAAPSNDKGYNAEQMFFEAWKYNKGGYPVTGVRRATKDEDKNGFDAFLATKAGEVAIQVKSSKIAKNYYRGSYGPNHAVVVIVKADDSPEKIRDNTWNCLHQFWAEQD